MMFQMQMRARRKEIFLKAFSGKKKKKEEKDDLNEEEILSETGSTSEDMSDLGLDKSKDLFGEIDGLDDLEDRTLKGKRRKRKRRKQKKRKSQRNRNYGLRRKKKSHMSEKKLFIFHRFRLYLW